MNRRDFLKAMAAVGVTAAAGSAIIAAAYERPRWGDPYVLAPLGEYAEICSLVLAGYAVESQPTVVELSRESGAELLKFHFNAFGGSVHWITAAGEEVLILRADPLVIRHDFDGAICLQLRDEDGYKNYYYPVSRAQPSDFPFSGSPARLALSPPSAVPLIPTSRAKPASSD